MARKKRSTSATAARPTGSRKPQTTTRPAPPVGLIIAVCVIALAVVVALFFAFRGEDDTPLTAEGSANSTASGGGVVVSEPDGAAEVVVYADYLCGACAIFEPVGGAALLDAAAQEEIALRVVTLSFVRGGEDGDSTRAANAGQCADDQGVFPAYHHLLYDWSDEQLAQGSGPSWTDDQLIALGTDAGVPQDARADFATCVEEVSYLEYVQDMQTQARRDGVTSTPSVLIDGTALSDDQIRDLQNQSGALQRILSGN